MPLDPVSPFKPLCTTIITVMLVAAGGGFGCGGYEEPRGANEIIGTADETVTAPDAPVGNTVVDIDEPVELTATDAKSSRGHPLEYRFDFDAEGDREFSQWSGSSRVQKSYSKEGVPVVKAQARCAQHPHIASKWSEGLAMMVGQGPETEVLRVISSYMSGSEFHVDEIDFGDAIADTVPYGSWITVFYKAADTTAAAVDCGDPMNKCLRYQKRFSRDSDRIAGSFSQTTWMPSGAEDTNPFGVTDSTSMNIGSVEYVFEVRAVDSHDRQDKTPAVVSIVGNFDPTLDGFAIENLNGDSIGDGDTLVWDWWAPADSGVTVDGGELKNTKTFYFVIKATGHDHPRERRGSGIYSWFYEFENVGTAGATRFARSDRWVDGTTVNALSDTFTWVAVYPETDVAGDEIFVNNPPEWNDKSYDFSVTGRDLPSAEEFGQRIFVDGSSQLINQYQTGPMGRWTSPGGFRIHIAIRR